MFNGLGEAGVTFNPGLLSDARGLYEINIQTYKYNSAKRFKLTGLPLSDVATIINDINAKIEYSINITEPILKREFDLSLRNVIK